MDEDRRSPERIADPVWEETLRRVRDEFDEMPCLSVTPEQARLLFGLPCATVSSSILNRLAQDGFLDQNGNGEYVRRTFAT